MKESTFLEIMCIIPYFTFIFESMIQTKFIYPFTVFAIASIIFMNKPMQNNRISKVQTFLNNNQDK